MNSYFLYMDESGNLINKNEQNITMIADEIYLQAKRFQKSMQILESIVNELIINYNKCIHIMDKIRKTADTALLSEVSPILSSLDNKAERTVSEAEYIKEQVETFLCLKKDILGTVQNLDQAAGCDKEVRKIRYAMELLQNSMLKCDEYSGLLTNFMTHKLI